MNREKYIKVRLSEAEHKRLAECADSLGITMSELIREMIKNLPPVVAIPPHANLSDIAWGSWRR